MSTLSDQILAADDGDMETINVPEWGVDVGIISMSGTARARVADVAAAGLEDDGAGLIALWRVTLRTCLIDPADMTPIFADDEALNALMDKSAAVLHRLWDTAWKKSGLGTGGEKDAGKDSSAPTEPPQSEDSTTG